jgi:prepilin-type N-terminal cleavage/methylation domain-containing protein
VNTTESFPESGQRGTPRFARPRTRRRGVSLVEVMVAATIFTVLAMSGTAAFLQNQRASIALRYRTQVTNTALNMLEQLRLKNYQELKKLRDEATAKPTDPFTAMVLVADPLYTPPTPDPYAALNLPAGLRPVELNLNAVDDKVINSARKQLDLMMESTANAPKLPTRYWLTLKFTNSTNPDIKGALGGIVQAMEIALVYQWQMPRQTEWKEGTIRLVVTNPQAVKNIAAATAATTP